MHGFIVMQNIIIKKRECIRNVPKYTFSKKLLQKKNHKTQQRPSCNNDDKLLKFRLKNFPDGKKIIKKLSY